MKKRLYSIMADVEEITQQLADMQNVLEIQLDVPYEENKPDRMKSLIKVQIRLLEGTKKYSCKLHKKIDDTILDIVHERI